MPLCFAFDSMSPWYSAVGYGWSGSYGSWNERRRGSWRSKRVGRGRPKVRSEDEWYWFCQKYSGAVLPIADTMRLSRTKLRSCRRPRYKRKSLSWRRRWHARTTRSLSVLWCSLLHRGPLSCNVRSFFLLMCFFRLVSCFPSSVVLCLSFLQCSKSDVNMFSTRLDT